MTDKIITYDDIVAAGPGEVKPKAKKRAKKEKIEVIQPTQEEIQQENYDRMLAEIIALKDVAMGQIIPPPANSTGGFELDDDPLPPTISRTSIKLFVPVTKLDDVKAWLKENITHPHTDYRTELLDGESITLSFNHVEENLLMALKLAFYE